MQLHNHRRIETHHHLEHHTHGGSCAEQGHTLQRKRLSPVRKWCCERAEMMLRARSFESSPVQSTVVPCTEYGRPLYGGRLSQAQVIVWEYKQLIIKSRLFRVMSVCKIVDFSRIIWYLGYKLSRVYTQPPVLPPFLGTDHAARRPPPLRSSPFQAGQSMRHAAPTPLFIIHYSLLQNSLLIIHFFKIHY